MKWQNVNVNKDDDDDVDDGYEDGWLIMTASARIAICSCDWLKMNLDWGEDKIWQLLENHNFQLKLKSASVAPTLSDGLDLKQFFEKCAQVETMQHHKHTYST